MMWPLTVEGKPSDVAARRAELTGWPLPVEGKPSDGSARRAELTGVVYDAARDGLPARNVERGLWPSCGGGVTTSRRRRSP
jgi:hypothetical protein